MSFVFLAILIATSTQNLFILPMIKSYIEKKAFEVSVATIERISDFSLFALLERTYENRLGLDDSINKIEKSNIEGLLGVSIYQRQRVEENISYKYLSGFGDKLLEEEFEEEMIKTVLDDTQEELYYDSYAIKKKNGVINTYRFIKPIFYSYQGKEVLLGVTVLYYDRKTIDIIIENMFDLIFITTILILLIATLFVYFIGVRFTRPILEITKASTAISQGNLDVKLDIQTNDEVEDLANQFNVMVKGLQERKKMRKFVSCSTMDMIQSDSSREIVLGGEYRVLTILFCDIRGFTSMSEQKKPSEVISIVNFYLNLQAEIIKENGGNIDKFIGDEIMASFEGEESIDRAIQAAVTIQSKINEANSKRVINNEVVCDVGIGINTGEVIVGNVGSHNHMDFTAMGLDVNIASRLCSKAKAKEIIVSKKSYGNDYRKYLISNEQTYILKGISDPLAGYMVFGKVD